MAAVKTAQVGKQTSTFTCTDQTHGHVVIVSERIRKQHTNTALGKKKKRMTGTDVKCSRESE
jgi:hypothetical protein